MRRCSRLCSSSSSRCKRSRRRFLQLFMVSCAEQTLLPTEAMLIDIEIGTNAMVSIPRHFRSTRLPSSSFCINKYATPGPHIAQLYVAKDAQKHLRTLGHFFKSTDTLENLLGLAAANYELTASIPAVISYLQSVPWEAIAEHEEKLQAILIDHLNSKPDAYQIYGEPVADKTKRVPVISWKVKGRSSKELVEKIDKASNFGCRFGGESPGTQT